MIESLTPEEYERRKITGISAQEEYLDKQLAYEQSQLAYIYGDPVEEPAPEEEPPVEPPAQAPETRIPWGLIGVIAVTGLIALSIVAVVAVKK